MSEKKIPQFLSSFFWALLLLVEIPICEAKKITKPSQELIWLLNKLWNYFVISLII